MAALCLHSLMQTLEWVWENSNSPKLHHIPTSPHARHFLFINIIYIWGMGPRCPRLSCVSIFLVCCSVGLRSIWYNLVRGFDADNLDCIVGLYKYSLLPLPPLLIFLYKYHFKAFYYISNRNGIAFKPWFIKDNLACIEIKGSMIFMKVINYNMNQYFFLKHLR